MPKNTTQSLSEALSSMTLCAESGKPFKSLTALYLYQVNLKPWTDDLNAPKLCWTELQEKNKKTRCDILDFARRKGAPFTAREIMDSLGTDKSRTDSAIARLERESFLRRANHNGRLHWELI